MDEEASPTLWQVAETFLEGKHRSLDLCEDLIVVSPQGLYAVIDGITNVGETSWTFAGKQVTPGRFAALAISEGLAQIVPGTPAQESLNILTDLLNKLVVSQNPDCPVQERPACSLAIFDPTIETLYGVGDCWRGILFATGEKEIHRVQDPIEHMLINIRGLVLRAKETEGSPWSPESGEPDPGRSAILPALQARRSLGNTQGKYGFGIMNGLPIPREYMYVHDLRNISVEEIVLASDGYPDISSFFLGEAEETLSTLLSQDPICTGVLAGTKAMLAGQGSYDDRAWLKLTKRQKSFKM